MRERNVTLEAEASRLCVLVDSLQKDRDGWESKPPKGLKRGVDDYDRKRPKQVRSILLRATGGRSGPLDKRQLRQVQICNTADNHQIRLVHVFQPPSNDSECPCHLLRTNPPRYHYYNVPHSRLGATSHRLEVERQAGLVPKRIDILPVKPPPGLRGDLDIKAVQNPREDEPHLRVRQAKENHQVS